jgi:hypothetical protein
MPRIHVIKDERYPDFSISDDTWYPPLEITDAELQQIQDAELAYSAAQKILRRAYEKG